MWFPRGQQHWEYLLFYCLVFDTSSWHRTSESLGTSWVMAVSFVPFFPCPLDYTACTLWDLSFPTRDWTWAHSCEYMESYPLARQGGPTVSFVLRRWLLVGSWRGAGHQKDQAVIRILELSSLLSLLQRAGRGWKGVSNWLCLCEYTLIKIPTGRGLEAFSVSEHVEVWGE